MSNLLSNTIPPFFIDSVYVLPEETTANQFTQPSEEANYKKVSTAEATRTFDTIIITPKAINQEEELLLQKIIDAVHSAIGSHEIIKSDNPLPQTALNAKTVISFGVPVDKIGSSGLYSPIKTPSFTFLYCDELQAINADTNKKLKLWNILKSIFTL